MIRFQDLWKCIILVCNIVIITSSISYAQVSFETKDVVSKFLVPDGLSDVAAGDINNDGHVDFVSCDLNNSLILWHDNILGTGQFANAKLINNTIRASEVLLDDLDEDGDLDLLALLNFRDSIFWLENLDGLGSFGPRHIINDSPQQPTSLNIADLDNDGRKDLLYTDEDGNIYLHRRNGDATIYDPVVVIENTFFDGAVLTTSDLDGDNNVDLILSDVRGNDIYWYKNIGGFSFDPMIRIDDQLRGPTLLHTSDLDNDGDLDLIVFAENDYELHWYENLDGTANFGPSMFIGEVISGYDIETADVNQDGMIDIVVSSTSRDKVSIYARTDNQQPFEEVILSEDLRFARSLSLQDIDNDDDLDIVTTSSDDNQMYWFDNQMTDWGFIKEPMMSKLLEYPRCMEAYDYDLDGDLDFVTSSQKGTQLTSSILWYENVRNGNFLVEQEIVFEDDLRLHMIKAADLDQDGDTDILATSSGKLIWYKNNGPSQGFEEVLLTSEFASRHVDVIDYDLDGDLDIVATLGGSVYSSTGLWLFSNLDGQETFDQGVEIGNSTYFSEFIDVKVLDFDNDGDEDLVVGESEGSIYLYETIADQLPMGRLLLETEWNLTTFAIEDIDLDGDLDFVEAHKFPEELSLYKDIGGDQSNYEKIILDQDFEDVLSVEMGDIDSDGDIDILMTVLYNDTLFFYENANSDGVFFPVQSIELDYAGSNEVQLSDIDQNGSLDPVIFNSSIGKISWLQNNGQSSSAILGKVHLDIQDNECTGGSIPLEGVQITTESEDEMESFYTLQNGYYRLFTEEGEYSTFISQSGIDYYSPLINEVMSNFSDTISVDTVDFCLTRDGDFQDLRLAIIPIDQTRPGFKSTYGIIVQNIGTVPVGGEVCIVTDSTKINFLTSTDSTLVISADSIVLDLDTLTAFESSNSLITYRVTIPQLIDLNEPVCIQGVVKTDSIDSNLENNVFKLSDVLVNSYDPNDIMVLEGSEVLIENAQNYLHYVIRFQNTGTASAINVRLQNEIDEQLDYTTLQLLSSSHNVRTTISEGSMAQFEFEGIYLPDSNSNEALSLGYVSYRIKPNSDLQIGDIIKNSAEIYFDFNDPIPTNVATTEIVDIVNVETPNLQRSNIYPIPATDYITISLSTDYEKIEIYDSNGTLVLSGKSDHFMVRDFPLGVYYTVTLLSNGQKVNGAFIKI
jgi:hypothetical protein